MTFEILDDTSSEKHIFECITSRKKTQIDTDVRQKFLNSPTRDLPRAIMKNNRIRIKPNNVIGRKRNMNSYELNNNINPLNSYS